MLNGPKSKKAKNAKLPKTSVSTKVLRLVEEDGSFDSPDDFLVSFLAFVGTQLDDNPFGGKIGMMLSGEEVKLILVKNPKGTPEPGCKYAILTEVEYLTASATGMPN